MANASGGAPGEGGPASGSSSGQTAGSGQSASGFTASAVTAAPASQAPAASAHPLAIEPAAGAPGFLAYLPPAWLAAQLLLALNGLVGSWTFLLEDYSLPIGARTVLQAGFAASVIAILWGIFVGALALSRSARFPRAFIAWQSAWLAWLVVHQAWVLAIPEFMFSLSNLALAAGEFALGAFCIWICARNPEARTLYAVGPDRRPPVALSIVAAILGVVVGGVVGFGAGLLAGSGIVELTDMSCFEGACGYAAFFIALIGIPIGAILGGVLAFRWARRVPKGS